MDRDKIGSAVNLIQGSQDNTLFFGVSGQHKRVISDGNHAESGGPFRQFGANAAQVILYQGSSTSVDVQLNNAGAAAYTNLAKLHVSGASAGVTAIPSRPYLSNGQAASIVLKADATAAVGTQTLTVTATGPTANGTDTKTATVNVEVRSKANVTGVKGRFIDSKGMGIGGVLVRHETNQVQTDSAGNFLLVGLPAGNLTLRFDATPRPDRAPAFNAPPAFRNAPGSPGLCIAN